MEVSIEEERSVRQFLQEFNKECRVSPTGEDGVQLRGSIVSTYRLLPTDVIPEVTDWVFHYLEQRKCPRTLSVFLAHHVAENVSKSLSSMRHSNGLTEDENELLIDSVSLNSEAMEHLHELCNHLRDANSHHELLNEAALSRVSYPVSVCGIKNTRRKMEDRHVVIHDLSTFCGLESDIHTSYYAIFDGHGGVDAANYSAAHLHWNIVQHPQYLTDLNTAMIEAFKRTDEDFLCRYSRDGISSGCTAICCIIRNQVLHMAWVGDSQAVLVRQGQALLFMEIHKPERQDEKQRIENMGGTVTFSDGWRVNNAVGVSRAIGDPEYKKWISSDADICVTPFSGTEDFLVIGCDGLWDAMSPADVTAIIYHQLMQRTDDIEGVASQLIHHAKDQGSRDNISAIIVFLRDPATLVKQATSVPHLNETIYVKKQNGIDENGLQDYAGSIDQHISNPYSSEDFAAVGGTVPEKTAFSELPTPPIEDVLASEEFSNRAAAEDSDLGNPFGTSPVPKIETEPNQTTEIASDIVNTAIETALEICSETAVPDVQSNVGIKGGQIAEFSVCDTEDDVENINRSLVENLLAITSDNNEEVSGGSGESAKGIVMEDVKETNPFAGGNTTEMVAGELAKEVMEDKTETNPFAVDGLNSNLFMDQMSSVTNSEVQRMERDSFLEPSLLKPEYFEMRDPFHRNTSTNFFSADETDFPGTQDRYSFGIHPREQNVLNEPLQGMHENSFFSAPDSLLLYGDIRNMQTNIETNDDLFALTGEAPSAVRSLQGVPEMLGISESVPGSRTPEIISVGTPEPSENVSVTIDEELDALQNLMDDLKTEGNSFLGSQALESVLETVPMLDEKITVQQSSHVTPVVNEGSMDAQFGFLEEMSKPSEPQPTNLNNSTTPQLEMGDESKIILQDLQEVPLLGEPSLMTDVLIPTSAILEPSLPAEISGIAKTEETPSPAVVVESIPENVPEAEGVTEDSDSEKDGGWKYISGEKQPKSESSKERKEKAKAKTEKAQPPEKDTHSTDTVKRAKPMPAQDTRKPLANKTTTDGKTPTIQKKPTTGATQSTMRKVPPSTTKTQTTKSLPSKTPVPASGTLKPKTATKTTTSIRPTTAPSDATKAANATLRTTATSSTTSRSGANAAASTTTMQRPASTIARKPKPATASSTMPKQPASSSATSTLRSTTTKTSSPRTNTLLGLKVETRKPLVNGNAATAAPKSTAASEKKTTAASEKKTTANNTMKPQRTLVPKTSTQAKETKDTVNKELSKMPSPRKLPATSTLQRKIPQNDVKNTLPKSTAATNKIIPQKTTPSIKKSNTLGKETLAPKNNRPSKSPQKTAAKSSPPQQAVENKMEKEKGSLEENTKETKPVDSGLASPSSPISPQTSSEISKGGMEEPALMEEVAQPMQVTEQ